MGNTESQKIEESISSELENQLNNFNVQLDVPDIRDYEFKLPENQIMEINDKYKNLAEI